MLIRNKIKIYLTGLKNCTAGIKTKASLFSEAFKFVGTTRFELATPSTPCWYATGLRYVPNSYKIFILQYFYSSLAYNPPAILRDTLPGCATSRTHTRFSSCNIFILHGLQPSRNLAGYATGLRYVPNSYKIFILQYFYSSLAYNPPAILRDTLRAALRPEQKIEINPWISMGSKCKIYIYLAQNQSKKTILAAQ